ncbi:AAA family ATPase [Campylobacter jejuni]|uniref:Anticodon nuclease n=4 Tax=cellular organisms TaxID=131567 RepID=A0A2I0T8D6_LIMLA|nr:MULTISPECIES: AAA family ATPase [Campylobacter]EBU8574344.1 anticodon nuclease [Salmonella enterica subsp. enterica serovar Corvallis]PKU30061.1 anticodon nuclease [Limosa lapponica baueri]ASE90490.1 anticodon nuclease [Campylobacter jejuni]EAB5229129.1 anticodon nuclease [Campylobacter jejuni]EAB5280491.1 anticodon nuclease [Campylobacter jejuni]
MSGTKQFATLKRFARNIRDTLGTADATDTKNYYLLFAYNGTGKTRLSVEFKNLGKRRIRGSEETTRDTLYYNAFTEDLFYWDNDLEGDTDRRLFFNTNSRFFDGLRDIEMDTRIRGFLQIHADFDFTIHYDDGYVSFSRKVQTRTGEETITGIKISRGEENLFVWCFFLAIVQLVKDEALSYDWVKYIYIDDPISSLDDNNVVALACQLSELLKDCKIKTVISTHHALFFNVMYNELRKESTASRFLSFDKETNKYIVKNTGDTPFFHHIALLKELKKVADSGKIYTYHFNILRNILEKTAAFHGFDDFSACIKQEDENLDDVIFARITNLLSHGNHSIFNPVEMVQDNKEIFKNILNRFLRNYKFNDKLFTER